MNCQYCHKKIYRFRKIKSKTVSLYDCRPCKGSAYVKYGYAKGCKELKFCHFWLDHRSHEYRIELIFGKDPHTEVWLYTVDDLGLTRTNKLLELPGTKFLTPKNVKHKLPLLLTFL